MTVEKIDVLKKLKEKRNEILQRMIEVDKLLPNAIDYDFESLKLDLADLNSDLYMIDMEIKELEATEE